MYLRIKIVINKNFIMKKFNNINIVNTLTKKIN